MFIFSEEIFSFFLKFSYFPSFTFILLGSGSRVNEWSDDEE